MAGLAGSAKKHGCQCFPQGIKIKGLGEYQVNGGGLGRGGVGQRELHGHRSGELLRRELFLGEDGEFRERERLEIRELRVFMPMPVVRPDRQAGEYDERHERCCFHTRHLTRRHINAA